MSRMPLPIIGPSYIDESQPLAAQESINCFPEVVEAEGARNVVAMKGTPGLSLYATVGDGPIRGMEMMAGKLYAVSGEQLYSVDRGGTSTSLGTVEGSERVGMTENGTQLVIVNGPKGYVYNKDTAVFAEITDTDFPGADTCAFLDQYVLFSEPDTERFFWSAISDATDIDALDFASAESATDKLLAVIVDHREIWLFGAKSTEVWINDGVAPFVRQQGASIERGIASPFCVSKLDNTLFWLGDNGIVYRANGYQPQRVSTRGIEREIAREDLSEAFSFAYETQGHAFFVLTFRNGKTWVYDAAIGDYRVAWHRRKSHEKTRWRANCYIAAYDKHLVGDADSGKIWAMDSEVHAEGDDPLVWERKTQYLHADGGYIYLPEIELTFDTGNGLASGQGSDPILDFAYSKDGGRTYSNFRQYSLGLTGEFRKRIRVKRLGRSRQWMFWLRISDPVRRDLICAEAVT